LFSFDAKRDIAVTLTDASGETLFTGEGIKGVIDGRL
jgi:hypothetical protein